MPGHFRNRQHHFWTHQRPLSAQDQLVAARIVESPELEAAIDQLESVLAPARRPSVAVVVVFPNEAATRHVLIELQGPTGLLALIRDRVSRDLIITLPDYRHTESHFLQVPLAMLAAGAAASESA
jgi:hypothetical protein